MVDVFRCFFDERRNPCAFFIAEKTQEFFCRFSTLKRLDALRHGALLPLCVCEITPKNALWKSAETFDPKTL